MSKFLKTRCGQFYRKMHIYQRTQFLIFPTRLWSTSLYWFSLNLKMFLFNLDPLDIWKLLFYLFKKICCIFYYFWVFYSNINDNFWVRYAYSTSAFGYCEFWKDFRRIVYALAFNMFNNSVENLPQIENNLIIINETNKYKKKILKIQYDVYIEVRKF